jgi:hypothetical protein
MTLDDLRARMPHLGFALYAYTPGGPVTLEILENGLPSGTITAPTEAEAIAKLFPDPKPEPAPPTDLGALG